MMKSWADHCSSDEESVDDIAEVAEELESQKIEEQEPETPQEIETQVPEEPAPEEEQGEPVPVEKLYDFPDKPPFTAFIGNLAFSVKDPDQLTSAITEAASDLLGLELHVMGGRIATDRRDGKHRGFGYVEVETLDELKQLMQLNEKQPIIAGRAIQVNTANQGSHNNRRGGGGRDGGRDGGRNNRNSFERRGNDSFNKIDGSNFRGGRFANNNNNSRRTSGGDEPGQRPSLKLAPRTKPREGDGKAGGSQNIFGGAKARDAQAWEKRRMSQKEDEPKTAGPRDNKDGSADRRRSSQSSRGGRGGRGGRTGGGAGNGRGKGDIRWGSNAKQNQQSPEEKAAAAAATGSPKPAAAPAVVQTKTAVSNKFALLMDSDSE